jgi:hypothetical protein
MRRLLAIFFLGALLHPIHAAPPREFKPDPASVQRCGPGYRYPQQGWIVVHIEGKPYDRGYQYGQLLAKEIATFAEALGLNRSTKSPAEGWQSMRTLANALFLRRYETEFLEEMKGIADGAATAKGKVFDRTIDFLDIVTINSSVEIGFLDAALDATPTGLESKTFREPPYVRLRKVPAGHCSAFAATGPATKDGQVVFGHITMWGLFPARWFNVWLDIKPEHGHRVMLQTYPGGIMSGMDYYQNDTGLLLTETTISQTKFDVDGWSLTARCRKAVQYADTIDECVAVLKGKNNGLYTNEWLMADVKSNEIAMLELGTQQYKLWRSSKNEWPGGTAGFYWGCNNTKDLQVRLETQACLTCRPGNMSFRPSERDKMWLKLYDEHKGSIDESFGFKAFTTPPLAAFPSLDAKFTTTALAKEFKSWGVYGHPMGRTWEPTDEEKQRFDFKISPIIPNDWTMLSGQAPPNGQETAADVNRLPQFIVANTPAEREDEYESIVTERNPVWNGTLIPKTDADIWLTAAFADYERIVARQRQHKNDEEGNNLALYAPWIKYHMAVQRLGRIISLKDIKSDPRCNDWHDLATGRGVIVLAKLRNELGAKNFDAALDSFGRANAGKEINVADFQAHLEKATSKSLADFFAREVRETMKFIPLPTVWSIFGFEKDLENTLIVYGTQAEAAANREAAERLQHVIARRWGNYRPTIKADTDATPSELRDKHLLLVGRPETNTITNKLRFNFPIQFGHRSFVVKGTTYASDQSGLIIAGANPDHPNRCAILFAGLGAEATWKLVTQMGFTPCEAVVVTSQGAKPVVLRKVPVE